MTPPKQRSPDLRDIEEVRQLIRERSALPREACEAIVAKRFAALPKRLTHAARHWPLTSSRVLDVGCSYGHCLVHFGPGSVGLDNVGEHVAFCRSLGLDARLCDVETGLSEVDDGSFDLAWVSDVIEHLDAPRLLLRRIAPKLKTGGRLVLFVSVLPRPRIFRALLRGHGWFDADVHHYQFTLDTARYLLERNGYAVESVVSHLTPPRLDPLGRLLLPVSPAVFIGARRDQAAEQRVAAAERRNKPARGR